MNRIQLRRRPLNSIAACAALSLAMVFAGTANADWAVNDKDANEKLEEIQNRIGKGDLNDTTSKLLEQIRISGTNLGFSATLTPNNQLQKISDASGYVKQACPSQGGVVGSVVDAIAGGGGASQNVTSLAPISAGKQQICQQLIQLRVQAYNDSIEMANRFQQYSEQLTKIDNNRTSAKTQGDLWANTNESLRTIGKLQAEMGFWRTRLAAYESAIKFHEGQQNVLTQTVIRGGSGGIGGIVGQLVQTTALKTALSIK